MPFGRQHGQEWLDLGGAHIARAPHGAALPMPADKKAHPIRVGILGLEPVVKGANPLAHLVQ